MRPVSMIRPATGEAGAAYVSKTDMVAALIRELIITGELTTGEQLRQRGAGMSIVNARGRGDMVARLIVETPTRMSSKQKKLLEEIRATETGDECPAAKGFFGRVKDMLGG